MLPIACKWKGIGAATWGHNPWGGGGGGGETEDGTIYIYILGIIISWEYAGCLVHIGNTYIYIGHIFHIQILVTWDY